VVCGWGRVRVDVRGIREVEGEREDERDEGGNGVRDPVVYVVVCERRSGLDQFAVEEAEEDLCFAGATGLVFVVWVG
jgi:hypothetical protein